MIPNSCARQIAGIFPEGLIRAFEHQTTGDRADQVLVGTARSQVVIKDATTVYHRREGLTHLPILGISKVSFAPGDLAHRPLRHRTHRAQRFRLARTPQPRFLSRLVLSSGAHKAPDERTTTRPEIDAPRGVETLAATPNA